MCLGCIVIFVKQVNPVGAAIIGIVTVVRHTPRVCVARFVTAAELFVISFRIGIASVVHIARNLAA